MNKSLSVSMELTTESPSHDTSTMPMPPQARVLLQMLRRIQHGALRLTCPDGSVLQFGESDAPVALRLNNWKPCMAAMKSGDIGFAESFIAGDWHTDDLTRCFSYWYVIAMPWNRQFTAAGGAVCCTACGTCSTVTPKPVVAAIFTHTTISVMRFIVCGWIRP